MTATTEEKSKNSPELNEEDLEYKIEIATQTLDRNIGFVTNCDNKTSIVLAAFGVLLAIILTNEGSNEIFNIMKACIMCNNAKIDNKLTNADVQSIATNSLKEIDPDVLGYVDLQFIVKRESYPPYTGNKSSVNSVVSWSNYKFEKTVK